MNGMNSLIYNMYTDGYSIAAALSACKLHGYPADLETIQQLYDDFDTETEYRDDNTTSY